MPYASIADLIKRKDERTLGDLVSDDGERVSGAALSSDAKLSAALDDASGDIDAALLVGNRYTTAELEALTGNSLAHLKRIACEIAMFHLLNRRPDLDSERWEHYAKARDNLLQPLRKGEAVFDIEDKKAAGTASVDGPTTLEYIDLNLIRDRTRNYFPGRRLPGNR